MNRGNASVRNASGMSRGWPVLRFGPVSGRCTRGSASSLVNVMVATAAAVITPCASGGGMPHPSVPGPAASRRPIRTGNAPPRRARAASIGAVRTFDPLNHPGSSSAIGPPSPQVFPESSAGSSHPHRPVPMTKVQRRSRGPDGDGLPPRGPFHARGPYRPVARPSRKSGRSIGHGAGGITTGRAGVGIGQSTGTARTRIPLRRGRRAMEAMYRVELFMRHSPLSPVAPGATA